MINELEEAPIDIQLTQRNQKYKKETISGASMT